MKCKVNVCLAAMIALAVAACGPRAPDTEHALDYAQGLMAFRYPGNWKVTEDKKDALLQYATLRLPGNAVVSVFLFDAGAEYSLADFIANVQENFNAEMEKANGLKLLKGEPSSLSEPAAENGWECVTETFSFSMFNAKVPHTRLYRRKAEAGRLWLFMAQSPDKDLERELPGINLVLDSLALRDENAAPAP